MLTNIVSMSIAEAYEREFGLSIPQWRVIAVLARYPELSAIEVAERTAMDKVAVSRAVQGLLASRRLVRGYDPATGAARSCGCRAAGKLYTRRSRPWRCSYEKKLLDALSPTRSPGAGTDCWAPDGESAPSAMAAAAAAIAPVARFAIIRARPTHAHTPFPLPARN